MSRLVPVENLDSSASFNTINAWPIRSTIFSAAWNTKTRARDRAHQTVDTRVDIAINRTISAMRRDGFKSGQI